MFSATSLRTWHTKEREREGEIKAWPECLMWAGRIFRWMIDCRKICAKHSTGECIEKKLITNNRSIQSGRNHQQKRKKTHGKHIPNGKLNIHFFIISLLWWMRFSLQVRRNSFLCPEKHFIGTMGLHILFPFIRFRRELSQFFFA